MHHCRCSRKSSREKYRLIVAFVAAERMAANLGQAGAVNLGEKIRWDSTRNALPEFLLFVITF